MWKIIPVFSTLMFLAFSSSQAMAWKAYHLYGSEGGEVWAIECNDGTLHSYSGSSDGLSVVGPPLCEEHGGINNPNGGLTPVEAEAVEVGPVESPNPKNRQEPFNLRRRNSL